MIAGLYPYVRGGVVPPPRGTLDEISVSLELNPFYRENLLVLAGDRESASRLEGFGLRVHRVFDDAPDAVRFDAAHKMKHWMCRWALGEFGEFLWVDWDTVLLRPLDDGFWDWCRAHETPKFIYIPEYWATVNCGVYYAGAAWAEAMTRSLGRGGLGTERRAPVGVGAPARRSRQAGVLVGRARQQYLDAG